MNPLARFHEWVHVDRMALATATPDGRPSVRMVLLKEAGERGFVFFSNYESRKGKELAANPHAALLIHVEGRQVRVEGQVERLPAAESDEYWAIRPAGSRRSRRGRPRGAATSSCRRCTSSGSTATIACTTASGGPARTGDGRSSGCSPNV